MPEILVLGLSVEVQPGRNLDYEVKTVSFFQMIIQVFPKNLIHNCRNNLKGMCSQILHQPDFLKASLLLNVYFLFDLLWFKFCIALLLFFIRKQFYSTSSQCINNFQICFETPLATCFRGYLWHCCCGAIKSCLGLLGTYNYL